MDANLGPSHQTTTRRRFLKTSAGALALGAIGARAPVVLGQAKEFKGVTIGIE